MPSETLAAILLAKPIKGCVIIFGTTNVLFVLQSNKYLDLQGLIQSPLALAQLTICLKIAIDGVYTNINVLNTSTAIKLNVISVHQYTTIIQNIR